MGARRLLTTCDFQPFFQVDLLLPILGNLGAVCHGWTTFPGLLEVTVLRHVYHVAFKICIKQTAHEQYMDDVRQVNDTSTKF